jgi:hypothetical protein
MTVLIKPSVIDSEIKPILPLRKKKKRNIWTIQVKVSTCGQQLRFIKNWDPSHGWYGAIIPFQMNLTHSKRDCTRSMPFTTYRYKDIKVLIKSDYL